jgi:hypothetical protein
MNCDIFTPDEVCEKMVSYFPTKINLLLEPSVGTGNLLLAMKGRFNKADVFDINTEYLSHIPKSNSVKIHHANFLTAEIGMYDGIIMNPPYARIQDMDDETRTIIRNMSPILAGGNFDLYIAFLYKCIQHLSSTGTMVAIIPSTWMYNKSCSKFREYLNEHRLVEDIHDYQSEKVFPNADVYCCILVLNKRPKSSYTFEFSTKLEGTYLDSIADIQNGVATLCDKVFIHDSPLYDEPCWAPIRKVSKGVTKFIIFPYKDGGIIPEELFRAQNPQTFAYLLANKDKLDARDKGKKTYDAWYAFGRKQGIRIPSESPSVYISTLCKPDLPADISPTSLFYSGIRLTPKSGPAETICALIQENKSLIQKASSKRAGGWLNISVGVLKQVPVSQ